MLADGAMSVVLRPGRLRHEMIRRGWAATDLARESRLSQATISAALAGRPIAEKSLALIAKSLSRASVLDVVDYLVLQDGPDMSLG
jgi:transcriptional regulator with XRE-family HTH domain